jgi:hypothetical protein
VTVSAAGERGFAGFAPGRGGPDELFGTGQLSPVVDGAGRVAFLRGIGVIGLLGGEVLEATNQLGCSTPVAMIPLPDERLLLGCRDGSLFALGSLDGAGRVEEPSRPPIR